MDMKNYTDFKDAQNILEDTYGDDITGFEIGGFHHRLAGYDERDFDYRSNSYQMWRLADNAINDGLIFYVEPFKCKCGHYRFPYGGGWACNDCGNCVATPCWWKVKVEQDGNMFICRGSGFVDLQESDNYAFGNTKQEAKDNYRLLFINKN